MDNKKQIGYSNEELVKQHYIHNGYELIKWNYTIQWWEIDLLMKKWWELVVIEVKTVNHIDELDNYITDKKIWFLQRTLENFLQNIDESWIEDIRMDVVFVKNDKILEIYEDVTNR
jgi:Holliday junction resolvase-like predicted endonuclease